MENVFTENVFMENVFSENILKTHLWKRIEGKLILSNTSYS